MTTAEEQVRALYTALAAGDIEAFVNSLADDVTARSHGTNPFAGEYIGKPAVLAWMQDAMGAMEESQTLNKYVASGDDVVAIGHETVTAKATGKSASGAFAHHWVMRDGQVVEFDDFETLGSKIWD